MYGYSVHNPCPQQRETHIRPDGVSRALYMQQMGQIDLGQKAHAQAMCSSPGTQLRQPLRAHWRRAHSNGHFWGSLNNINQTDGWGRISPFCSCSSILDGDSPSPTDLKKDRQRVRDSGPSFQPTPSMQGDNKKEGQLPVVERALISESGVQVESYLYHFYLKKKRKEKKIISEV